MILAQFSVNADPRLFTLLLTNPGQIANLLNPAAVAITAKFIVLVIMAAYFFFCFIVYVQIHRLENWLFHLRRYHFSFLMLIQMFMVAIGWVVALLIL